jgi:hypothetical protein
LLKLPRPPGNGQIDCNCLSLLDRRGGRRKLNVRETFAGYWVRPAVLFVFSLGWRVPAFVLFASFEFDLPPGVLSDANEFLLCRTN